MKLEITLKNNIKIILRHLIKSDINGVWKNFNDVVDEAVFLPVLTPVISELEKNPRAFGERVIFIHTGGIFGLFPFAGQLSKFFQKP